MISNIDTFPIGEHNNNNNKWVHEWPAPCRCRPRLGPDYDDASRAVNIVFDGDRLETISICLFKLEISGWQCNCVHVTAEHVCIKSISHTQQIVENVMLLFVVTWRRCVSFRSPTRCSELVPRIRAPTWARAMSQLRMPFALIRLM